MRLLIFAGEHPAHLQHVQTVLDACDSAGDEYVFYIGKEVPKPGTFAPRNPILHRFRDFCWDRFGWSRNRFDSRKFVWQRRVKHEKKYPCKAIKGHLPWKPDIILVVTPHEGHARYQVIPWARREGIPVVSIDHGMPTVAWPWAHYRSSMMGCTANAVWSEVCKDINIQLGAPPELQIITGAPSIDRLSEDVDPADLRSTLGLGEERRLILMLGTHRPIVKEPSDTIFREVIAEYADDSEYQIVFKPHPVELSQGTIIDTPDSVIVTTDQADYIPLIKAADIIISPPSSVVVPATAFNQLFVNTITAERLKSSAEEVQALLDLLGAAVFPPDQLHEVIRGELGVDESACNAAFTLFGYRRDGRNGERVLSFSRHIAIGGKPNGWKFS